MKKKILVAVSAVLLASGLGYGSYWAYNEYTVLSSKDAQALMMQIVQMQYQAYQIGAQSCKNSI